MHSQIIVEIPGDKIIDKSPDGRSPVDHDCTVLAFHVLAVLVLHRLFPHIGGAELGLGLAFEVRFLDLDADGADDALAEDLRVVVLLEEVFLCLGDGFPQL